MENLNAKEVKEIVIRFSGDSGDGMQLTGTLFSNTSALEGNGISTFPDYPAEIRAPQGTVAGVSGFQVHIGAGKITNPGDFCDALVAMNPAALKANRKWLKKDATVIIDGDTITEDNPDGYPLDIYQYFLTNLNYSDVEYLSRRFGLLFMYSPLLDYWVLCVPHFGTMWKGVPVVDNIENM